LLFVAIVFLAGFGNTVAQAPPSSIQIFLPNGGMPSHAIQLSLARDDGFTDTVFTDSKGIYVMRTPTNQAVSYTVTIQGDRQMFDTTTINFRLDRNSPARIPIFLKALSAERRPGNGNSVLDVANYEGNVPPKARAAYKLAMESASAGHFDRAIPDFQEAIAIFPEYVRALNDLGVAFMKVNRLDAAAKTFRKAIELDKRFFHPQMNLGIVLNKQGKYQEALEVLAPLYAENRGMLELRLAYGQALGGAGQVATAEKIYRSTLESKNLQNAVKANLYFRLGVVLNREGHFVDAVLELERALALDPDGANTHVQLGAALMQLQQADRAERELVRAYQLAGAGVGIAQLLLGQIYYAERKFDAAEKAFEQYLKDVPSATNYEQIAKLVQELKAKSKQ